MSQKSISEIIIEKYGLKLYEQAFNFPINKINIIYLREEPSIKIRSIILDNDREFHLIVNENKSEIFHDCPTFLIFSTNEEKICIHLIKVLLLIKEHLALKILENLEHYKLTSEDFGSKKKSKNFLLLANRCFETNSCVEGLNYLNKAIINQSECENIIKNYLERAIEHNLFIEFFEFIKSGYENELEDYFLNFKTIIEKGFKKFLNGVAYYSFFNLLRILNSMDQIFNFKELKFPPSIFKRLKEMLQSTNINEKYFALYFIKKHFDNLIKDDFSLSDLISETSLEVFKNELIDYFKTEIDNFCIIDKLKLLKKQFQVIDINTNNYLDDYKKYKEEIRELEKKVYLKKFAYLKLLMEKLNVKPSKVDFRKKRNTYIVNHRKENIELSVYHYIISRIGFFGLNNQTIKSSEMGFNYFFLNDLFLDDLNSFLDVLYYKKQFWEDLKDYKINSMDGYSLLSKAIDYEYDIDQKYSNINDVMIIEWDLANRPIHGSLVNAYGSQILIPDQNNPLFHDLKPFDLTYCKKNPVKIEGNLIKTINIITKCSFKFAIDNVAKGMAFIDGFYPLSLVKKVLNRNISPFKADELVVSNPNKTFIPNYNRFIKEFRRFLFDFISKERNYIFEELKLEPEKKVIQFLTLLNLKNKLAGLNLPYLEIINKIIDINIDLNEFKSKLISEIEITIKNILKKREIGSTNIFNLKKLRNTPYSKYSNEILNIRNEEFEAAEILSFENVYNISELRKTYYGDQLSKILKLGLNQSVKPEILRKVRDYAEKLHLKLNIVKRK
jgi:hypothetical protein